MHGLKLELSRAICPRGFGAAAPALSELRFQLLAAVDADPGVPDGSRRSPRQCAEREPFVGIIDVELGPRFHHRQIAQGTSEILIAQLASNSGRYQHVPCVSDL
jgi:hypothetical protein